MVPEDSMTKKWSSTASLDGQTKRQASKKARREFVESILKADSEPPEAEFDNVDDMLAWLDDDLEPYSNRRDCPWKCGSHDPDCLCAKQRT
jgi:hypothetical protein